jgi:hypothetical protein
MPPLRQKQEIGAVAQIPWYGAPAAEQPRAITVEEGQGRRELQLACYMISNILSRSPGFSSIDELRTKLDRRMSIFTSVSKVT